MTLQSSSPWHKLLDAKLEKEMLHRTIPLTSYYLFRQHVLPDVFGNSHSAIMYWSGKSIGNDLDVNSINEMVDCFDSLQLGSLLIKRESSVEIVLRLQHSPLLQFQSLKVIPPLNLSFECGFITGMLEKALGKTLSGHYEIIEPNSPWPMAEFTISVNEQ